MIRQTLWAVIVGSIALAGEMAEAASFESNFYQDWPLFSTRALPFTAVTFKDGGATDSPLFIWSGDRLLNLDRNEALKMTVKGEHLFIEAGGFSEKNPFGWKSPVVVLKQKENAK